jgi:serine/threonine protein kinase
MHAAGVSGVNSMRAQATSGVQSAYPDCVSIFFFQVDIWASGVTLYYMVEGSAPFKGDTVDELYSKISEADYKMPQRADNELNDLIENILKKSPDERFTLEQILDHQWLERSETDNIKLTEMLSGLKDRDNDKKKSLMKRFMEEEEDDDDDPPSDNPADDDDGLETEREKAIGKRYDGRGGNLEADGPLHKQNHELQKAKVDSITEKCVIC